MLTVAQRPFGTRPGLSCHTWGAVGVQGLWTLCPAHPLERLGLSVTLGSKTSCLAPIRWAWGQLDKSTTPGH